MIEKPTKLDHIWPRRPSRTELCALSDLDFQELLRRIRKKIVGRHGDRTVHTARKKAFNNIRRKLINTRYPSHQIRKTYSRLAKFNEVKAHPLLDALYPERIEKWKTAEMRHRKQQTDCIKLKNFSFIDNPVETFKMLTKIVEGESLLWEMQIDFEDEYCLDIGPYLVLGVMFEKMAENCCGGKLPFPLRKVLQAVDVDKFLDIQRLPIKSDNVWPIKLERGRAETIKKGQRPGVSSRQMATDRIVKGIDSWLKNVTLALSDEGKMAVAGMLGEVIDNAERHSLKRLNEGEWSIAGFMVRRVDEEDGQEHMIGHIGIISLGQTVSESLSKAPKRVRDIIDDYISRHKKTKLHRDSLITICALQDTISCDPVPQKSRGGTGFMDIIDFTAELGSQSDGSQKSNIAILSGHGIIIAKDPYARGIKKPTSRHREQWFNDSCKRENRPDAPYVLDSTCNFPGTLVSIRFELDKEHMQGAGG